MLSLEDKSIWSASLKERVSHTFIVQLVCPGTCIENLDYHQFSICLITVSWCESFFFLLPQKPQSKLSWLRRKFEHMANCTAGPNPEAREQSVCVCVCVCVFYGEPRATGLEADWDMSQTPSCQRCNSIPEETWIDAVNSTSDKSSLELVNFTSRAWTL